MPDTTAVIQALNQRYFQRYPEEALRRLEDMTPEDATVLLKSQPPAVAASLIERMTPDFSAEIIVLLPEPMARAVLASANLASIVTMMGQLDYTEKEHCMSLADASLQQELRRLMDYPEDSAGRFMDTRVPSFRETMTVQQCLRRIRQLKSKPTRILYVIDANNRLVSQVEMQDLILSDARSEILMISRPLKAVATPMDPREEVVAKLEEYKLSGLPVLNIDRQLMGVIRHDAMVKAVEEEATVDIQTMFGVSKDERALSGPVFAVRKRLPWLQINLLTAFLAASVVGLFEGLISQFTALAVLLPVVAGQSGNAGAQALAVTMRGLALREISSRQWKQVLYKEVRVGFLNGVAVAATTGIGVYYWSRSLGLAAVISMAMVLSMVAAGFAGASVPIILTRLGQDPATASSIILTTVTDVAGFFSFLGIATLLSAFL
ncbi:MAG: magnesium transporter [Candidatus Nitrohelix vancouverensis]|uniref:Magnesium transporter n=1 Tax=Candidatus Nitrohelix vancouverensis TaxID=2705534 RepID=A0A7T0G2E0_9BACT|nr:MAG: magnesium transporter [Candidatus Nitrohelix vancouverensis]